MSGYQKCEKIGLIKEEVSADRNTICPSFGLAVGGAVLEG
jgi:hypothetical protein